MSTLSDIVIDSATGSLYVPTENDASPATAIVIRKISLESQSMSILAGRVTGTQDGVGTNAQFGFGTISMVLSPSDGHIYLSDSQNNRIKQIVISTQTVTTIAGSGENGYANGVGISAKFSSPDGITLDSSGNLYVADAPFSQNPSVRKIVISTRDVTTLAGRGTLDTNNQDTTTMVQNLQRHIRFGGNGHVYVYAGGFGNAPMLKINVNTRIVTSLASVINTLSNTMAADSNGNLYLTDAWPTCRIMQYNVVVQTQAPSVLAGSTSDCGTADGVGANIKIQGLDYMTVDSANGILYFYDRNSKVFRVLQASAPCTAGKWCPNGSSTIDAGGPCPAGYYCPQGSDRIPCPGGKYCTAGLASAAQALPCQAGKYCPPGSSAVDQGGACPAGYFCALGADRVACTAGKYCGAGSDSLDKNGVCAAGYYCLAGQERVACVGFYCEAGESVANRIPCTAGYACPGGGVLRTQCAAGSYAAQGSSTCTQCPRGLVAASVGAFLWIQHRSESCACVLSTHFFHPCIPVFPSYRQLHVPPVRRGHILLDCRRRVVHCVSGRSPMPAGCRTARRGLVGVRRHYCDGRHSSVHQAEPVQDRAGQSGQRQHDPAPAGARRRRRAAGFLSHVCDRVAKGRRGGAPRELLGRGTGRLGGDHRVGRFIEIQTSCRLVIVGETRCCLFVASLCAARRRQGGQADGIRRHDDDRVSDCYSGAGRPTGRGQSDHGLHDQHCGRDADVGPGWNVSCDGARPRHWRRGVQQQCFDVAGIHTVRLDGFGRRHQLGVERHGHGLFTGRRCRRRLVHSRVDVQKVHAGQIGIVHL
jgi:hypothetical protein